MRSVVLMVALVVAGCGSDSGLKPGKVVPKVGDKHILATDEADDVFTNPDDMRRHWEMVWGGSGKRGEPEFDRVDRSRIGLVVGGDLVEVLEVGDDFAAIDMIRKERGEPGRLHSYVRSWWKSWPTVPSAAGPTARTPFQ